MHQVKAYTHARLYLYAHVQCSEHRAPATIRICVSCRCELLGVPVRWCQQQEFPVVFTVERYIVFGLSTVAPRAWIDAFGREQEQSPIFCRSPVPCHPALSRILNPCVNCVCTWGFVLQT